MHYISTRDASHQASLSEAIARGIAPDGGLYVPAEFPHFPTRDFDGLTELADIGEHLIAPFAEGDPLAAELGAICREAFNFPAPLNVGDRLSIADAAGYTMVKKNWFNGVKMPSIVIKELDGSMTVAREFGYADFAGNLG